MFLQILQFPISDSNVPLLAKITDTRSLRERRWGVWLFSRLLAVADLV